MRNIGLRISDSEDGMLIKLSRILGILPNGERYHWHFGFVDGMPQRDHAIEIMDLIEERSNKFTAREISWDELNGLCSKFFQIYDLTILGSIEKIAPEPYESEWRYAKRYDFVATLVDGGFWEVYCKDKHILDLYYAEFLETKWITDSVESEH